MLLPLALAFLLPAAHAASTTTVANDVPMDMKTLYREMFAKVDPRLKAGDYLGVAGVTRGYLESQSDADLAAFLLDVQAPFLAATGDDEGALVSMTRAAAINGRAMAPRRCDDEAWAKARAQVKWREPAAVLREAAKTHGVIMISEAHHSPETRALGRELLPILREAGFEYLAMETLYHPVPGRPERVAFSTGPGTAAGYYFFEPQLAGLARDALALGFTLVAYEDEGFGGDREEAQARNLYERVLKAKPDAKVLVWAGYAHVNKRRTSFGKAMAERVWELTGREPFTLYQIIDDLDPYFADAPLYKPLVLDAPDRPRRALVLENKPGLFPALDAIKDTGVLRDAKGLPTVDGYIVHPPFRAKAAGHLRPAWVMSASRRALTGSVSGLKERRALIQAFPRKEGFASTPADQMIVEPDGRFELWVTEGDYLIRIRDGEGRVLIEDKAPVGKNGAALKLSLSK